MASLICWIDANATAAGLDWSVTIKYSDEAPLTSSIVAATRQRHAEDRSASSRTRNC